MERNEKAVRLTNWFDRNGIEGLIIDLDDTICQTNILFLNGLRDVGIYLGESTGINEERLVEDIRSLNVKFYHSHKVNPCRWGPLLDELRGSHPEVSQLMVNHCAEILGGIYTTVPEFCTGAEETMRTFTETGREMSILTHANVAWTEFKHRSLELNRFVPWNMVRIADENRDKGPADWYSGGVSMGLLPQQVMVIGDSFKGDILASAKVGVRQAVHLIDDNSWSVTQSNEPYPLGVVRVIGGLGRVVDVLLNE